MESLAVVIFCNKQVSMLMVSVTGKLARSNFGDEGGEGGGCRESNDLLTMLY